MGMKITITGNREYCDKHGLYEEQEEDCFYCEWEQNDKCVGCRGTSKMTFREYQFEMDLANGSFYHLWNALGLQHDPSGDWSVDPRIIQTAMRVGSEIMERDGKQEGGNGKVLIIESGYSPERCARYFERLKEIADEAERREERVVWG